MKMVYMCHGWFKNRGLRERPLTENDGGGGGRGLSELAHTWKRVLELNITNKHILF